MNLLIPPWKKKQNCLVAKLTDDPEVQARAEAGHEIEDEEMKLKAGQLDQWWLERKRKWDAEQAADNAEYCKRWDRLIGDG